MIHKALLYIALRNILRQMPATLRRTNCGESGGFSRARGSFWTIANRFLARDKPLQNFLKIFSAWTAS
jgi:hypothetical protein